MRPILVVWAFGYLLVEISAYLTGRTTMIGGLYSSPPLWVVAVLLSYSLHRLWQRPRGKLARTVALIVGLAIVTILQTAVDLNLHYLLSRTVRPEWSAWAADFGARRVFVVILLYLWTFCLAETLLWAGSLGEAARVQQARAEALEVASHRAEATALRLQLNPHFLFNTLNGVASLVVTGRVERAQEMLGQLADFLRASLSSDPTCDVRLDAEVATASAYLQIEAARFGDRISFVTELNDGSAAAMVQNFIIQPLVENAVKHGVRSSNGPVEVKIAARRDGDMLHIAVINRGEKGAAPRSRRSAGDKRPSLGLANVRQRLKLAYGDRATLDTRATPDGFTAELTLPFEAARPAQLAMA